jgi:hypothetical protein
MLLKLSLTYIKELPYKHTLKIRLKEEGEEVI